MKVIIVFLSVLQYVPYFFSMYKGKTQPSVSGWLCFSLSLFITIVASISMGIYSVFVTCGLSLLCQVVIIFIGLCRGSAFRPDTFEKWTLWAVFCGVFIWGLTNKPALSIYVNMIIDVAGTVLILKKLYVLPGTESPSTWFIGTVGSGLSVWYFISETGAGLYYLFIVFISNAAVFSLISSQRFLGDMENVS